MIENAETRYKRYEKAQQQYNLVSGRLEDIYRYFLPSRSSWGDNGINRGSEIGSSKTSTLYDSAPQDAVFTYANNLQYSLMPPYQTWHYLKASPYLETALRNDDAQIGIANKALQAINNKLFASINSSNFAQAINEAYLDLACSTGVLFINIFADPFSFVAIPPNFVCFEEDAHRTKLENFWNIRVLKARDIKQVWSNARINNKLANDISSNPEKLIEVVEGCIYYPEQKGDRKYFYYVQLTENKEDIYFDWLPFCPYTGFRAYKTSGETWGRGVADRMLPYAKLLNLMGEYAIKAIKFSAYPVIGLVGNQTPAFNTKTVKIEPGSTINMPMPNSLQKLDLGGNIQEGLLSRQALVTAIQNAFFVQPLGNIQDYKDRTATESAIRRSEWLRQNAVSIGRLENEATRPILHKCLLAMREKGLIKDLSINGQIYPINSESKLVDFEFDSPLIGMQNDENMQKMDLFVQRMANMYGANSIAMYNNAKIPGWYAQESNIDLSLILGEDKLNVIVNNILQTLEQNRQQLEEQKLQQIAQAPVSQPTQEQRLEGALSGR